MDGKLMTMKGYLPLLLPLCILGVATGCSKDDKPAAAATTTTTAGGNDAAPVEDESGLIKKDVVVGKGNGFPHGDAVAETGDTVVVMYSGKLENGTEFDSSAKHGNRPYTFAIDQRNVIHGWDLGIKGMKAGGERDLTIPSKLGYGEQGKPPDIPGGATLKFHIKVLDVVKKGADRYMEYRDVTPGTGAEVKKGQIVAADYEVKLMNGQVIDSSKTGPVTVTLGGDAKFPALDSGILGDKAQGFPPMKVGGVRELHLGPSVTMGNIPPDVNPGNTQIVKLTLRKINS